MDAYLERFERFAASNNWGQKTWAVKLSALLPGKALDFYARLQRGDAGDYNKLKQELLKHYDFTEEGYRRRFRNCKPEDGETPTFFVERLSSYLQKWIQLAGLHEEYADLRDLITKEQILNACSKEVAAHLREQKSLSLKALTESTQGYLDAHNLKFGYSRPQRSSAPTGSSQDNQDTPRPKPAENLTCYRCGAKGHKTAKCQSSSVNKRSGPNNASTERSGAAAVLASDMTSPVDCTREEKRATPGQIEFLKKSGHIPVSDGETFLSVSNM
nr:hypothetical protein BaRGS_022313 [Batillaria attramentaria]